METIPLEVVPNQSLSVTIDRQRWTLTIKAAVSSMVVDLALNDEIVAEGLRVIANQPLIPYRYLATTGNFLLLTLDDEEAWWENFGSTQELTYATAEEIASYG